MTKCDGCGKEINVLNDSKEEMSLRWAKGRFDSMWRFHGLNCLNLWVQKQLHKEI